jgi:hypothetical protein
MARVKRAWSADSERNGRTGAVDLQSVTIADVREFSRAVILRKKAKVRGMVVKGMGKSVFTLILTIIPLTFKEGSRHTR